MNSPGVRRHSASPRRERYELARRPSDPERPYRDYSPSRRQYPPRLGHGDVQSSVPTRSGDVHSPQSHPRTHREPDLRVDTRMDGRARDGSHTMSAAPQGTQAERDYRSPETPYSSAGPGPTRRQNHAQRRTAKWKAGGSRKGGNYSNNQQRQYQNRRPYNRNQPDSAQDDIQSSKSPATPPPSSPNQNSSSPFDQYTNRTSPTSRDHSISHALDLNLPAVSPTDLDHAKDLVLDLLGWGVPPQHLLDRGVSSQLMHRVFTDLQLQLPQDFVIPPHTLPDTPVVQS